ncbi:uncharacterized protein LOC123665246, partial [Melitaea cinxia]|uniref:uncharacterized protein LOC123665246 n=1 Tax=Melitaea cinxia TaxID=113334 RepID=UPI001E274C4F
YKNFILCGELNYCCLLCQESFIRKYYVDKHLVWEDHKNNMKKQEYFPKFRKDFIYKIPDGRFYCEFCNLAFKTVEDHIKEKTHQDLKISKTSANRRSSVAKYIDKFTIKISSEKITIANWHGLSLRDNMCLLCNESFGILLKHIASYNHVVKLIESETISENGNHYRKQGKNSFYCFICFKVYDKDDLDAHWTECHQNSQKLREEKDNKENMKKALKTKITDLRAKLREKSQYFNFDVANKAVCLQCKKELDLEYDAMESHIRNHEQEKIIDAFQRTFIDRGKRRAELADYGKKNFIMLNRGGSMGYCTLCYTYVSAHINVAKQHVEGTIHRGHLELRGLIQEQKHEALPYELISQKNFVELMRGPHKIDDMSLTCINNDICVSVMSYMLISRNYNFNDDIFKCYCCNEIVSCFDLHKHTSLKEHKKIIYELKVLLIPTNDGIEFIRQIHPNLYHCGYCHTVFPFWENVKKHLKNFKHRENRIKAKRLSYLCNEAFDKYPELFSNAMQYRKRTLSNSSRKD